jgi:hypothetical protein
MELLAESQAEGAWRDRISGAERQALMEVVGPSLERALQEVESIEAASETQVRLRSISVA